MKIPFKIILLMLITSTICYGQRHQILKKSIEVDKNFSIVLNIENIYVVIEESTDGKIHFDYSLEFDGYAKKDIQKTIDGIKAEVSNFDKVLSLKAISENQITFETIKTDYPITLLGDSFNSKKTLTTRKTRDSLLKELRRNNKLNWRNSSLKYINDRFKTIDKNGKLTNFRKGQLDIMRSQFIIKLPPFIKVNINSKNSGIFCKNDLRNELSIKLKSGTLKTKGLYNNYNDIVIEDANFEAEFIAGGNYELLNVRNGKVGTVMRVDVVSEFSKVEIGEVGLESKITDFNSEYWFYNWTDDFKRFDLYSEYSKIHLFYPKKNFDLKVVGNNTKSLVGNGELEINMQPTKKGEKYTMMTTKADPNKNLSGNIFFDIVHGIIYTHEDKIKKINKD